MRSVRHDYYEVSASKAGYQKAGWTLRAPLPAVVKDAMIRCDRSAHLFNAIVVNVTLKRDSHEVHVLEGHAAFLSHIHQSPVKQAELVLAMKCS